MGAQGDVASDSAAGRGQQIRAALEESNPTKWPPPPLGGWVARCRMSPRRMATCGSERGQGDSFVEAFDRASNAGACALAVRRAPVAPIRLQTGLHSGEVQLRDEGHYIGSTVNRGGSRRGRKLFELFPKLGTLPLSATRVGPTTTHWHD
jgi:class 3 adenylate cyclase